MISLNGSEEIKQNSTYQQEIVSETNDIEELPEGNFPMNLKFIAKHQREGPSIIATYQDGIYHKGYFNGFSNIDLNLIKCKGRIFITSKLQSYVLHWYHKYLLHPGMDRMEETIHQHLYWPYIRDVVQKEVTNCDTFQHKKRSNKKYGRLTAKVSEEIPWNKLCVDLIGTYCHVD